MFDFDQDIVNILLEDNQQFQSLFKQHHDLKERVKDAELGLVPMDNLSLGVLKKEKLLAKDKMAAMIEQVPATARLNHSLQARAPAHGFGSPRTQRLGRGFSLFLEPWMFKET